MTDRWDEHFESTVRPSLPYLQPEASLTPDASLLDLGLDSVQMVSVLVAIEEKYGVEFPDDMLTVETFATPSNLWRAVSTLSAAASGQAG